MKFLIIQTAFIGDVILATSLIESLHKKFPDATIDFLLRKGNENLLKSHPYLNKILIWNKKQNKYKNILKLTKEVRKNKYDHVVNCQRFVATGFLTAFSKAKQKSGFSKNPFSFMFQHKTKHEFNEKKHEIDRNNELIKYLTNSQPEMPCLYPSPENYENIKKYQTKPYICMAPASVWFTKQLPVEKWIELINATAEKYTIYLVGAPGDKDLCKKIAKNSKHNNIKNIAGEIHLLETAAMFQKATMNYTNDSAPLHIASAMKAPLTAFFCSTTTKFGFGPLTTNAKVAETTEKLPCRPCGIHGKKECPEKHFKCGYTINTKLIALR